MAGVIRGLLLFALAAQPVLAASAAEIARAIRENTFDLDECYRVRDLTIFKDDLKLYLTDGHLIFSKPVAGRRVAAVFTADVDGGDAEVLLRPPDAAERRSLATYIDSATLDEHFRSAVLIFTGDEYSELKSQFAKSPANKKAPELAQVMQDQWGGVLRNIGESYQTRLTLDLLGGPGHPPGLFSALIAGQKLGNFDVLYDPQSPEQISAGQVTTRNDLHYFNTWTSFRARAFRSQPEKQPLTIKTSDYRIEATVNPDLSMSVVTRVKVEPVFDGMTTATFSIAPAMTVSAVTVDGKPAEVFQRDSLRSNITLDGNGLVLVIPAEPMRAGRQYEFEFHHSGKVIVDAGDKVYYVAARSNWYPIHHLQFAKYDLAFRYPQTLDLVTAGDIVEDRADGEWHFTRRRTAQPVRLAGFNLGSYRRARAERGNLVVEVCANRTLERTLQSRMAVPAPVLPTPGRRRPSAGNDSFPLDSPPNPTERVTELANEIAAALEFMSSKFGPPALPKLTVAPIPGTFGQGFPGLIYLSTLAYMTNPPAPNALTESQEIFFRDVLETHETAHQWWGNRVTAASYRDNWLMEALANYSALLYIEKTRGAHAVDVMLDSYRTGLLQKNDKDETVESAGPIVLGQRLESSRTPAAWRAITYGKGTWILQMLRRRMGDDRFLALLAQILKDYNRAPITTEQFRIEAAKFMPPKSDDPQLQNFFDQWVYGTGIPSLKMTYSVKGKAPAFRVTGTITQSGVDEDFATIVPVEIQIARGKSITQWVRASPESTSFSVALKHAPLKVTLDPNHAVLRK